jgi:hypothetical protein
LTSNIWNWAQENFEEKDFSRIFVKSSTGFYVTEGGKPNGATFEGVKIMLDNAGKLPVKAAGGVKTPADAEKNDCNGNPENWNISQPKLFWAKVKAMELTNLHL